MVTGGNLFAWTSSSEVIRAYGRRQTDARQLTLRLLRSHGAITYALEHRQCGKRAPQLEWWHWFERDQILLLKPTLPEIGHLLPIDPGETSQQSVNVAARTTDESTASWRKSET